MAAASRRQPSSFFHTHTHSEFSVLDGISSVESMVARAHMLKQPGIAITDHGNMSSTVQLYRAGQKYDMQVFPGVEGYLTVDPLVEGDKKTGEIERFHIGLLSLNLRGYQDLIKFVSLTHTRPRFWKKFPRFHLNDLAALATIGKKGGKNEDVAVLTGCYFGLVQQTLVNKGYDAAKRIVEMYARWFPNTFVELQNHNIDHSQQKDKAPELSYFTDDSVICDALYQLAQEVGLPVVVTQDSHYLLSKEVDAHDLMKRMVYGGDEGQNEFPGDSFHLASTTWVEEHHDPAHWKEGVLGNEELLRLWDLQIPPLDTYKSHIPTIKKDPQRWLTTAFYRRLKKLEQDGRLKFPIAQYIKRGEHELDIVEHLGQAGYFSLWDWFVGECRKMKICIEARGSANNFLLNYVLGITSVDPLEWDLLPERFLSKDRKKPPDIDMDIEATWRDWAVALLEERFGVVRIGTYGELGARDDDKGSVLVSYNSYLRQKMAKGKFVNVQGGFPQVITDVRRISEEDYAGLRLLSRLKVRRSYGVHAAGLLLPGDDQKIEDYVPTMLIASSETKVTQFTQDDVDELGYTKMDILGQRTLTVLKRCQELMGREDPCDFAWIPNDDKETCNYLSKGEVENGIFQFEGYSMAKGARMLKIRNTKDCITAGALFRPACIDSGMMDLYLERRFDRQARKEAEQDHPHPIFAKVFKDTNGIALFQEQVLQLMRELGMDYEGINKFFKIVKDSGKGAVGRNLERLKEVEKQWSDLCKRNGIKDVKKAWHYIEGYSGYGFGKGHSTGYGLRSYRAAYLKTHYPLEFMAATLEAWAGRDKEAGYIKLARNMGIRLLPPDVNVSGVAWTLDTKRGAIRKGLSSIKGIGAAAAEDIAANAPYEDLEDMFELCGARSVSGKPQYLKEGTWSGNLLKLRDAGALSSLGIGRDE